MESISERFARRALSFKRFIDPQWLVEIEADAIVPGESDRVR